MSEHGDGQAPKTHEEEATEKIDALILDAHGNITKSLTDLDLIVTNPDKHVIISPRLSDGPSDVVWDSSSHRSRVDQRKLPWPFNQPGAYLFIEEDGGIQTHWRENELTIRVSINPGNPTDTLSPLRMSVSKKRSLAISSVQEYAEGMYGFSYSHYPDMNAVIRTETFTPKAWTNTEVRLLEGKYMRKPEPPPTKPGFININNSRAEEAMKLKTLKDLTQRGDFIEAIPEASKRATSLPEFVDSEAWRLVSKLKDSLAEATPQAPIQTSSRFRRFLGR